MYLWLFFLSTPISSFESVGKIHTSGSTGLSMSKTNKGEQSTYYFEFELDNSSPPLSILQIDFPSQYSSKELSSPLFSSLGLCSLSSNSVSIHLNQSLSSLTPYTLSLSPIKNPENSGGTGNFGLSIRNGNNLLNINSVFAVLGISDSPKDFESATVSIKSGGSLYAGDVSVFEFRFKLSQSLQAWHWLRFIFPENFQLASYPACSAFVIEGNFVAGVLSCSSSGSEVMMTGISEDLIEGKEYGVRVTASNPPYSGVTGNFAIETGRNSTFTVIHRRENIEGVIILPGRVSEVSLKPFEEKWVVSKKKKILYRLKFLLKNRIDRGGWLKMTFSNSFNMDYTTIKQVEYGLEDVSLNQTVQMDYDLNMKVLIIREFQRFDPVLISLLLEINNPGYSGPSDVIKIESFLKNGVLVDQDTKSAKVQVSIYSSPTSTRVTYPGVTSNQATGEETSIRIHFYPQVEIPQLGFITLNIPSGFNIISSPICNLQPTNMPLTPSPFCDFLDGTLTIQLFSDTSSTSGKFLKGVESFLEITNIIAPESSGWYLFDFNTYSEVWDFLESGLATADMFASTFKSFTFDVEAGGIDCLTILTLNFETMKVVPKGFDPFITTDTQGGIEILLQTMDASGNLLFDLKLGTSKEQGDFVPCQGSLIGMKCELKYVPSNAGEDEWVVVVVKDFDEIPVGSSVSIQISGIYYVASSNSPEVVVTTFKNYNRQKYELETGRLSLVSGSALPGTVTSTGLTIKTSSSKVNSTTTLSFSGPLPLSSSTSTSPSLMFHISPSHELGYCKYSFPTCQINSISYPCTCFKDSDMILIKSSVSLSSAFEVTITDLLNPESVSDSQDMLKVYLVSSYQIVEIYSFSSSLDTLQAGTFTKVKLVASSYGQGFVNTDYVFELIPEHYLKESGSLSITFPSQYFLSSSGCICRTEYLQSSSNISCEVVFNTISISGFISTNSMFLVHVSRVKNPQVTSINPFKIKSFSKNGLIIDQHLNFAGITLTEPWQVEDLPHVTVKNSPSNANATSVYRFSLTPSRYLGKLGYIEIVFPLKQFPALPLSPSCWLEGSVRSLEKCETLKNKLKVTLDQELPFKVTFIDVYGILNFPQGKSDSFEIRSYFDDQLIQKTFSPVYLETSRQASALHVKSLNFYPRNEGEKATYVFEFIPIFDISPSSSIVIRFPIEYDQRIGSDLVCFAEGLYGTITCELTSAYTLAIQSDEVYYACKTCLIKMFVYGVVNPNSCNSTGQFVVGIKDGESFNELNEYSGTFNILPAADYLDIETVLHGSLDSRAIDFMTFNLTTSRAIPSTEDQGSLWFTFPKDYPLLTDNLYCTSSDFWSQGVPDCRLYIDTLKTDGQTEEFYGNFFVSFSNLPYPLTEVYAGFITVKVFDGENLKLLARTYPNLSPNRLRFSYAGPLIIVNDDQSFQVTAGTMSDYIRITLDYPCALNLTLIPSAEGFSLVPSKVLLQTGDVVKTFRISVPKDSKTGKFFIYWTIHGEIEPNYYVPILPTLFEVITSPVKVFIEQPVSIPRGGLSLPVVVSVINAPDSDFTVKVKLLEDPLSMHLSFSLLKFRAGDTSKNFTIRVLSTSKSVKGYLSYELTGSNMDSYFLPFTLQDFDVFTDKDLPEVLSIELQSVSRTTSSFLITTNKICSCFFAFALRGTEVPSFEEVFFGGPAPFDSTRTRYGWTRIIEFRQGSLKIEDLTKETQYSLFVWLLDLSGFSSEKATVLDFKTDTRYKAAELRLYFDQTYLTYEDTALAQSTLCLLLSLADWRVVLNTLASKTEPTGENSPSSQGRSLNTVQSFLVFTVLDVDNSEVYPRPLDMIAILSKKKGKLKAILNNFDSETEIKGVEIYMDMCDFEVYPSVVEVLPWNVTVLASLRQDGVIQAVISESENSPFAFQVSLALDYLNRRTLHQRVQVKAFENNYLVFDQLSPNTSYFVFLICSNLYPAFPDLMSDANLVKLSCATDEEPQLPSLKIESSVVLGIGLVSLIVI